MRLLILLLVLSFSVTAFAFDKVLTRGEPITLHWVAPTQNTDNSPLSLAEIDWFTAYWTCDTGKTGKKGNINNTSTTTPLNSNLMLGQCEITMTATAGLESNRSESVRVLVKLPKPSSGGFR